MNIKNLIEKLNLDRKNNNGFVSPDIWRDVIEIGGLYATAEVLIYVDDKLIYRKRPLSDDITPQEQISWSNKLEPPGKIVAQGEDPKNAAYRVLQKEVLQDPTSYKNYELSPISTMYASVMNERNTWAVTFFYKLVLNSLSELRSDTLWVEVNDESFNEINYLHQKFTKLLLNNTLPVILYDY